MRGWHGGGGSEGWQWGGGNGGVAPEGGWLGGLARSGGMEGWLGHDGLDEGLWQVRAKAREALAPHVTDASRLGLDEIAMLFALSAPHGNT